MGNHNEMKKTNAAFTASYERFIKGYQQYKAERTGQQPNGGVKRYDNSTRVK
ncbi:hypothetical protein KQ939_08850 [Planococcus sp. CP5-4]|uniref:hypothetical protein n=1 Tax=unclassified Planococcus (in: firmicutes) TaxID=2662419 RepID=UPI001C230C63|nr:MULTISPECIES: hypothetical protein [unclassified Planococcus (in: firmicutes)]MBU9675055.1 hypothetical protein [Planococcus sp. CP5-4_YE]MBV0910405.1 hypothetical protein [Planococcus sp. CP5-4_UN]MBW6063819.1 hypothetical protein [Planococcus sp. CP5-4]